MASLLVEQQMLKDKDTESGDDQPFSDQLSISISFDSHSHTDFLF